LDIGEMYALITVALSGIAATIIGVFGTYSFTIRRDKKRSEQEFRNAIAIVYQEIKDNTYS